MARSEDDLGVSRAPERKPAAGSDRGDDRDRVDLSAVTSFLRRLRVTRPAGDEAGDPLTPRARGVGRDNVGDVGRGGDWDEDRDRVDLTALTSFLRRHRMIPPARNEAGDQVGPGATVRDIARDIKRDASQEGDRDRVDLTALASFLRRRRVIPPAKDKNPPILVPNTERRAASGQPASAPPPSGPPAAATKPAATKPAATKPAATKPAASNPAASNPAASNPAASGPAASNPAASGPAASIPAAAGAGATTPGPAASGPTPAAAGADLTTPGPASSDVARSDVALLERPASASPTTLAPSWLPAAFRGLDWGADAERRAIAPDRTARLVVAGATLAYIWLFSSWTLRHHAGFGTQAFDFGIFDQGLWLMSRFKVPFISINGRNLFGDHTSFIMIFLVPFAWVFSTAKVLLISQAMALGGAAVPVFLMARERLRNEMLGAALAVVYLLHPAVSFTNLDQYHPEVYEVPILMFALWFMVKRRWVGFLVCVGLALLVKEDVALMTFPLGVYVAFRHDRRVGAVACLMSAFAFLVALYWILPMLNGVGTLNGWRIPFGGPRGLITTAIFHPGELVTYATQPGRPWYAWQMLAPVALMPLFVPRFAVVGLAPLASNVLSTFYYQYDIHYHYATLILPVLMGGTILAIAKARTMAGRQVLVGIVTASALVTAYLWGPTPLGRNEASIANPDGSSIPYILQARDMMPDDAILSAHYTYVSHMNHREKIYNFPNPFKANYWGTFKTEGQRLPEADEVEYIMMPTALDPEPRATIEQLRPEFETIFEGGNVTLLKRKAPPAQPTPPPVPQP